MNALRLLIALAILAISCNNNHGPENDPAIKVTETSKTVCHRCPAILDKWCTFPAVITEVDLSRNLLMTEPLSQVWDEDLKVAATNFSGPPSHTPVEGDTLDVLARTTIRDGQYVWTYSVANY